MIKIGTIKGIYVFEFEDREHKREFEEYLNDQEFVKFKRYRTQIKAKENNGN